MDIQTIKVCAEYGSIGLYALGAFAFLVYVLFSMRAKHLLAGILLAPVWPIFLVIAYFREKNKTKKALMTLKQYYF